MLTIAEKTYTVEEYFGLERNSEIRHEFVEGEIIQLPQKSKVSNRIVDSLFILLHNLINENIFNTFIKTIKLSTVKGKRYRYPDVMVVPVIDDEDEYTVHKQF
jgi:Uma2 family endonuclease